MASQDRRSAGSIEDQLRADGPAFDFYRAVAWLEALRRDAVPIGQGEDPSREAIRFESTVGFDFPASDVAEIAPGEEPGAPAKMRVNFLGLAGGQGPLPNAVTEVILQRVSQKDTAFKAFLDIFNHRLVSLAYRLRRGSRVGLEQRPPDRTPIADYLFALTGLGTPRLKGRMGVPDRALIRYAGLLAGRVRSQSALEALLSAHFGCRATVHAYQGRWLPIAPDEVTRIGTGGRNNILGRDAVLGGRVWDLQGSFTIEIGPLTLAQYLDFLPIGSRFRPLLALTRFFVGDGFDFDIRLTLAPEEIGPARIGRHEGALLGWTSWLGGSAGHEGQVGTVRLAGRAATEKFEETGR
jgi:type VI secretion system protein ImpH